MASETFTRNRIETFTDGVFTIVITLLFFNIKVPEINPDANVAELWQALSKIMLPLFSEFIAFFIIAVIWANHHRLFAMFKEIDHSLFWCNNLLLLWVSFLPFPTSVMGNFPQNPLAVSFFGFALVLVNLSFVLMRFYVGRNPRLLEDDVNLQVFRQGTRLVIYTGTIFYLLGALIAWYSTTISFIIYFAIPIYFVFPHATRKD